MAHAVENALDSREHLLVEAGTGTGKSLAYLLPALRLGKPVVVSTSTKALQSQLIDVDLPRLLDSVTGLLGRRPDVAILKGRANYLCKLRVADSGAQQELPGFEPMIEPVVDREFADASADTESGATARFGGRRASSAGRDSSSALGAVVVALKQWATETDTGDLAELPASIRFDQRAWNLLSVSARECVGREKCSFGEECFAELARERAAEADLVVTNHHLLALDLHSEGRLLPDHRAVVIDEAHDFVDRVTGAMTEDIGVAVLERLAARLPALISLDTSALVGDHTASAVGLITTTAPGRLAPVPESLAVVLRVLASALTSAGKELTAAMRDAGPTGATGAQIVRSQLDALTTALDRVVANRPSDVVWLERPDRGRPALRVAPLDVAPILASKLFGSTTVIATSATLTAGGGFEGFGRRLGLTVTPAYPAGAPPTQPGEADQPSPARWHSLDVGSPFDYDRQAILYVAEQLPDPSRDRLGHAAAVREHLAELVTAAGGGTLGLFTSYAAAAEAAAYVRTTAATRVLLQGDAPLGRLVEQFRSEPKTCLFGTLSLWQGVDVRGPTCQLVVIDKLPFPRPDDPLPAARAAAADAAGGNGFVTVYAARAAVLLAQGVGRLIRSDTDRGVVAILDPRVATKSYGRMMLDGLPPLRRMRDPAQVLAALARLALG